MPFLALAFEAATAGEAKCGEEGPRGGGHERPVLRVPDGDSFPGSRGPERREDNMYATALQQPPRRWAPPVSVGRITCMPSAAATTPAGIGPGYNGVPEGGRISGPLSGL